MLLPALQPCAKQCLWPECTHACACPRPCHANAVSRWTLPAPSPCSDPTGVCEAQVLLPGAPARALAAQAEPLLAAALDGRAAAALALGRSGAGKTWTLSGGGDTEQPGALCIGSVGVRPFVPACKNLTGSVRHFPGLRVTGFRRLPRGWGAGPEAGGWVWGMSVTRVQSPPELLPRPRRADGAAGGAAVCAAGSGARRRCARRCHRPHDGIRDRERARHRPARGPHPAAARAARRRSDTPEALLLRAARTAPPGWLAASTHM